MALSPNGVDALVERRALVAAALQPRATVVLTGRPAVRELVDHARRGALVYLLDVNRATLGAGNALAVAGRRFVLDTGDDAAALARSSGTPAAEVARQRHGQRLLLALARLVVCRGWFHAFRLAERRPGRVAWVPDTAPDWLFDVPLPPGDPELVATFGTVTRPDAAGRWYGQEVLDLLVRRPALRSLLVGRGPGLAALRRHAEDLGVAGRARIEGAVPLERLVELVGEAAWLTSVQSDDPAGWSRTTGKLPLALAAGRTLLATSVGEAARVLPARQQLRPAPWEALLDDLAAAVDAGAPADALAAGRALAETYRRSACAARLRSAVTEVVG